MKQKMALMAVAILLVAPAATAHGAPAPASHEVRVVHDDNDDTLLYAAQGQGVLDNIALDVREIFHLAYGNMLVFKLILNDACTSEIPVPVVAGCGTITQTINFDGPNGTQTITLTSEDNGLSWTSDALYLVQPYSVNDGDRFAVEVGAPFSTLGINVGDSLTNFVASTDLSGTAGDYMPGSPLPDPITQEVYLPPLQEELRFSIDSYLVRAPDYYMDVAFDAPLEALHLEFNEVEERTITVSNPLEVAQTYTIFSQGPHGFHTSFSDGATSEALLTFSIPEAGTANITFTGHNGATTEQEGDLIIHLLSSGGGYYTTAAPIHIEAKDCDAEHHDDHSEHGEDAHSEHGHAVEPCPVDHTLEEHEETEEHHEDGHEHAEEGHTHSDEGHTNAEEGDSEETPFVGPIATIALLGAVLALRRK